MLNGEQIAERAYGGYRNGLCCSEAIVLAFAEAVDPVSVSQYLRMSSGLCGGMGIGDTCGVLTGCACAAGMVFGRSSEDTSPLIKCSDISKMIAEKFSQEFKVLDCNSQIKQLVKGSPEQRHHCGELVRKAARFTADIINKRAAYLLCLSHKNPGSYKSLSQAGNL